jgi:hypothetical protein
MEATKIVYLSVGYLAARKSIKEFPASAAGHLTCYNPAFLLSSANRPVCLFS